MDRPPFARVTAGRLAPSARAHWLGLAAVALLALSGVCALTGWAAWRRLAAPRVTAWRLAGARFGHGLCFTADGAVNAPLSLDLSWELATSAEPARVIAWFEARGWQVSAVYLAGTGYFELAPRQITRIDFGGRRLEVRQAAVVNFGRGLETRARWEMAGAMC